MCYSVSVFSNNKLNPNRPLVFFYILTTLPVALFCRTWDYFTQNNNNNNNTYCKIIYSFSIFLKLIYFRRFYRFLLIYSPIFFATMSNMIRPNPIQYWALLFRALYWALLFRTLYLRPHHSPVSKNLTIRISFDAHAFDPPQI